MVFDPSHSMNHVAVPAGNSQDKGIARNKIGKLKWLLHCTMGCQDTTFDTRKRELAILKGKASDADVLLSYISSVDSASSDPWMLEFIRFGHVVEMWEEQKLFFCLSFLAKAPTHSW